MPDRCRRFRFECSWARAAPQLPIWYQAYHLSGWGSKIDSFRVEAGLESGVNQREPTSLPTNPNPRHSAVAIADRSSSTNSSPMTTGDKKPNAPQVKYRLSLVNPTSASVEPRRIAATANISAI